MINCGVPQGSILGPLMFLIYINDISVNIINCTTRLYADDTILYCSGSTIMEASEKLQKDLDTLGGWCTSNMLSVNTKKSKVMLFGTQRYIKSNQKPDLKLSNSKLEYVNHYKYLGVDLDETLNFKKHVQNVCKLASHKIDILSRIKPYITNSAALQVYKSKILSYIDYGDVMYEATTQELKDKLDRLQYRAIRICFDLDRRTHRQDLLDLAKLPRLCYRRQAHLRNFMYKRKNIPDYIDQGEHKTRIHDAPVMITIRANNSQFAKSVLLRGANEWNSLTAVVRNIPTLLCFKNAQKKWLHNKINAPF